MIEVWKNIEGYEGYYMTSNLGRVKSLERIVNCHGGQRLVPEMVLKNTILPSGYLHVGLCKEHKTKNFRVHRLVAQAFLPNPENLPCVNHKDEDKTNNFIYINDDGTVNEELSNLEWCDMAYNNRYGGRLKRVAEKNKNNRTCKHPCQYTLDGTLVREWVSLREIENETGFGRSNIAKCAQGKYKSAYGYIWRYK